MNEEQALEAIDINNPKVRKIVCAALMQNDETKGLLQLAAQGTITSDVKEPEDGMVIIKVDGLKVYKMYKLPQDMSNLMNDCSTPGIGNVSQVIHGRSRQKFVVPYWNLDQTESVVVTHIQKLKHAIINVLDQNNIKIAEANIIVTKGHNNATILQVCNYFVESMDENINFSRILTTYLTNKQESQLLITSVEIAFQKFAFGPHLWAFPLATTNTTVIPHHLVNDAQGHRLPQLPMIVNHITVNTNGNNNTVTINVDQTNKVKSKTYGASIEDFVCMLKKDKPEWAKNRNIITATELAEYYKEYSGSVVRPNIFGKMIANRYPKARDQKKINLQVLMGAKQTN